MRLIPAHAGKTPPQATSSTPTGAHPRSRGENAGPTTASGRNQGSSPLTRGKPNDCALTASCEGLIPAHAGKTPISIDSANRCRAHPRSRGENGKTTLVGPLQVGSSPLTRGKQASSARHTANGRLIPAHAGKTLFCLVIHGGSVAHPRSRGENLSSDSRTFFRTGSSPLTRGKPAAWRSSPADRGLIPAHAGKTGGLEEFTGGSRAHPRSRGENVDLLMRSHGGGGSSPLTRGKHVKCEQIPRLQGLIPAHAGKTPF